MSWLTARSSVLWRRERQSTTHHRWLWQLTTALLLCSSCVAGAVGADERIETSCQGTEPLVSSAVVWPRSAQQRPEPTANCWLDWEQAELLSRNTPITWVDVRTAGRARLHPLSGALQIPLAQLPERTFLQGASLLLIGSGFDRAQLTNVCRQLRAAGFLHLYLLEGGVQAWAENGGFIGGMGFVRQQLSAEEWAAASTTEQWRIITVGVPASVVDRLPQPPEYQLTFSTAPQLISTLETLLEQEQKTGKHSMLATIVVASDANYLQFLRRQLPLPRAAQSIFWLEGGWEGYWRYVEQQHRIVTNTGRSLRRPCGA